MNPNTPKEQTIDTPQYAQTTVSKVSSNIKKIALWVVLAWGIHSWAIAQEQGTQPWVKKERSEVIWWCKRGPGFSACRAERRKEYSERVRRENLENVADLLENGTEHQKKMLYAAVIVELRADEERKKKEEEERKKKELEQNQWTQAQKNQ